MSNFVTNNYKNKGFLNLFTLFIKFFQIALDIVYKIPYNSRPQTLEGL